MPYKKNDILFFLIILCKLNNLILGPQKEKFGQKFKPCIYMGLIEYLHRRLLGSDSQKVLFHHLMEIWFLLYGSVGLRNEI